MRLAQLPRLLEGALRRSVAILPECEDAAEIDRLRQLIHDAAASLAGGDVAGAYKLLSRES